MLARSFAEETLGLIPLRGGLGNVPGVALAGVQTGIKARKRDVAVIAFERPQTCASVVTTNDEKAAPILVSDAHLRAGVTMHALVCNSGCANACTGQRGMDDALATARRTAELLGIDAEQVVIASTGVIGVPLPMDRLYDGLERAVSLLEGGAKSAHDAAEAIMTTDRVPKLSAYAFYHEDRKYVVGGIGKGSGMIAPSMATMLAFIATDFPLGREPFQTALTACVDESFNMISVDGDMSTNDAVYAFAPAGGSEVPDIAREALRRVCLDLAQAMVADGEGATKKLEMHVSGALDGAQARAIARAVVNSNLVKTALYGEDPNWGRVVAAAGSARAGLNPATWSLFVNGRPWVGIGGVELLSDEDGRRELEHANIHVELHLGLGGASATAWGCDLSRDYVRINASYRT
ncbi:MAG TPA: bifunctional glutamate N-acetyltransferase/amino-acid acetyltransferase ArgJ [Candidatus Tumulicola sp.]